MQVIFFMSFERIYLVLHLEPTQILEENAVNGISLSLSSFQGHKPCRFYIPVFMVWSDTIYFSFRKHSSLSMYKICD